MNSVTPATLHACNLANVAYGYVKILREFDYPAEVRCHDLQHLMSQPEWDDLELCADDFPDEWNFHNNRADLGAYQRPDWYRSQSVAPFVFQDPGDVIQPPRTWRRDARQAVTRFLQGPARAGWRRIPLSARTRLYPLINLAHWMFLLSTCSESLRRYREFLKRNRIRVRMLAEASARYGREWRVSKYELARFQPHAWWLHRQMNGHDVLFAYVLAPIYAMLLEEQPWISIEIGTMREIPFDGTDIGRMLALAYRRSPHVLITNPDVVNQARRLGVRSYSFCPHPLDEDAMAPVFGRSALRGELEQRYGADLVIFAPARQNWAIKGNDRYLRAYAELLKRGVKAVLIIPGWGQEVERSQVLCRDLGIDDRVAWIRPQSEQVLIKYYQAADLVLDQFVLGVFGLTTPKAMACGAVVLTSYDRAMHDWCFPEHPPLVACRSEQEIFEAMYVLAKDPGRRQALARASREWVCRHHSKRVVRQLLSDAMDKARMEHERRQEDPSTASRLISAAGTTSGASALLLGTSDDLTALGYSLPESRDPAPYVRTAIFGAGAQMDIDPVASEPSPAETDSSDKRSAESGPDYDAVWRWPLDDDWLGTLARYSRRYGADWAVRVEDLRARSRQAEYHAQRDFAACEVILAVGAAAVPALLTAARPYVVIERGTSAPCDPASPGDRVQLLACREASAVIVTDAAAFLRLRALGIDHAEYLPSPLDCALWDPATRAERERFRAQTRASFVLWHPLPLDRAAYATDEILRAFAAGCTQTAAAAERKPLLCLLEDGPDLEAVRALAAELEIDGAIHWVQPNALSEEARLYRVCDMVLDSLRREGTSVTCIARAAACGVAAAGAYPRAVLDGLSPRPPVFCTDSGESLVGLLDTLRGRPQDASAAGAALAAWYAGFRSKAKGSLRERLEELSGELRQPQAQRRARFEALSQKRLELRYESASAEDYDRKYHAPQVYRGMDERLARIIEEAAGERGGAPLHLLDLGCGPGSLTPFLRRIPGAQILGVDLSAEMIRYARLRYPEVEFRIGDIEALDCPDGSFDAVLCSGMLHHLPRLDDALREIRRVLRPGGVLIAREPNEDNFAARHPELAFAHLCLRHHLYSSLGRRPVAEPEAHDYHHDFTLSSLAAALADHFHVYGVHTDLRVSYFYEMLDSRAQFARVEPLEETLANQPGLNIVVVARKAEAPGITVAAQGLIERFTKPAPVDLGHFRATLQSALAVCDEFPLELPELLSGGDEQGWEALAGALARARRIAVVADVPEELTALAGAVSRAAGIVDGTQARVRALTSLEVGRDHRGTFDVCIARLRGLIPAAALRRIVESVADYGFAYCETRRGGNPTDAAEDLKWLAGVPVIAHATLDGGRSAACISPSLYTAFDALKALLVALDVKEQRESGSAPVEQEQLRREIAERVARLGDSRIYSHLHALAQNRSLLKVLGRNGGALVADIRSRIGAARRAAS